MSPRHFTQSSQSISLTDNIMRFTVRDIFTIRNTQTSHETPYALQNMSKSCRIMDAFFYMSVYLIGY
jgi:hypothetical protein